MFFHMSAAMFLLLPRQGLHRKGVSLRYDGLILYFRNVLWFLYVVCKSEMVVNSFFWVKKS